MRKIDAKKFRFSSLRSWDTFFAYCESGLDAVRALWREILAFRIADKPAKKNTYKPTLEELEGRITPVPPGIGFTASTYSALETTSPVSVGVQLRSPGAGTYSAQFD